MTSALSELAAMLHSQELKARLFRKEHHTFRRQRDGYVEFYRILGGSHNQAPGPSYFWLEVGVAIPREAAPADSPASKARVHAWGSMHNVIPGSPWRFEVAESSLSTQAEEIAHLIDRASDLLPSLLPPIVARVRRGAISVLPLPDTWDDSDA